MSDSEPVTLDKAAESIGWTGKKRRDRLRRCIESREKDIDRAIMQRIKGPKQTHLRVSIGALRKHMPELFDSSFDEMSRGLRNILHGIDTKLDSRIENHPKIQELWARDEAVMRDVSELAKRVARMA